MINGFLSFQECPNDHILNHECFFEYAVLADVH